MSSSPVSLPAKDGQALEQVAIELAALAGAQIIAALDTMVAVRYKGMSEVSFDPVSEVDERVEALIAARLREVFPDHGIIGEEMPEKEPSDSSFVWCVDPIDGTTNFVNGFPLFAASIGVLHRGVPAAGAVWCSTSHRLRAGVYHARCGGELRFDGIPVQRLSNPAVSRGLVGTPNGVTGPGPWDGRKTGSAALEAALVAAGVLRAAHFRSPNIWDVAGGVALVRAAGGVAMEKRDGNWSPLDGFRPGLTPAGPSLRTWRGEIVIGDPSAAEALCD